MPPIEQNKTKFYSFYSIWHLFSANCFFIKTILFLKDDIEKLVSKLEEKVYNLEEGSCMDAVVLPLHGSLPPELQASKLFFFFHLEN